MRESPASPERANELTAEPARYYLTVQLFN
jgi:hypothetical protein